MLRGSLLCLFSADKLRLHAIPRRADLIFQYGAIRTLLAACIGKDGHQHQQDGEQYGGGACHSIHVSFHKPTTPRTRPRELAYQ